MKPLVMAGWNGPLGAGPVPRWGSHLWPQIIHTPKPAQHLWLLHTKTHIGHPPEN